MGTSLAECIRGLAGSDGKKYVKVLHKIVINKAESSKDRITAANALFARGWGLPPQEVDLRTPDGIQTDGAPLTDILARLAVLASTIERP